MTAGNACGAKRWPDEQPSHKRHSCLDEKAFIFKVRYLHGRHGCRCGGHKREGGYGLPVRSVGEAGGGDRVEILWHRREISRDRRRQTSIYVCGGRQPTLEGVAEPAGVSRGHSRWARPWKRKFLGYSMTADKESRLKVSPEAEKRLKSKLRRGRGRNIGRTT